MSRTLLFSVEDTPGNSIEVFVSGDYTKHIPDLINRLKDLDRICHPKVNIEYTDASSILHQIRPGIGYFPNEPFEPNVVYLIDCDCVDFLLEDTMRVSSPAFADKEDGHYIDISKSLDDRIIGLTLWVDVLNEYICLKDVGNTWESVQSYTFTKKGKEYALSVWLKDKSIVGFRMVIMQKDVADEVT